MKQPLIVLLLSAILAAGIFCGKKESAGIRDIRTKSGVEMISLLGGEFMMGEPGSEHKVILSPFYIDKYEVTQEMFRKLELPNPSHFKGDKNPVEMVAWVNAAVYCNERSLEEGLNRCYNEDTWECNFEANGYRLPTEAEWEYAAKAGTKTKYFFGTDQKNLKNYTVYSKNSSGKTAAVGSRKPNPWGLYDMYGNVAEWCHDIYSVDYYKFSPQKDPRGPLKGKERVIRGGSWRDPEEFFSSYTRAMDASINDACILRDTIGFRCVRKAD
jgi:formylglycine-generating enzyme required for sulfatase activity